MANGIGAGKQHQAALRTSTKATEHTATVLGQWTVMAWGGGGTVTQ